MKEQLLDNYVIPYRKGEPLFIGGRNIESHNIEQVKITWAVEPSSAILPVVREDRARERKGRALVTTISDEWHVANRGRDVTHEFIAGSPGSGIIPGQAIVDSGYLPHEIVMTSGEAIRIIGEVKSGYEDLRGTFDVNQVERADELEMNEKLDKILTTQNKIVEYNSKREKETRIGLIVGSSSFILGFISLIKGDYRLSIEEMGFGIGLIALVLMPELIIKLVKILVWIIGALFCVVGLSEIAIGNHQSGIVGIGIGIVLIAARTEAERQNLTKFFKSILGKIWKSVLRTGE